MPVPYSNALRAVSYYEDGGVFTDTFWEVLREANKPIGEIIEILIVSVRKAAPEQLEEEAAIITAEMATEDFRRYVMAKMGMM